MNTEKLIQLVVKAMEDRKAHNIRILDVRGLSVVTDTLVIASGNSDRQVVAIATHVAEEAKHQGQKPLGMEGKRGGEWVLVDLGDVVVHVMQPETRDFYQLEKLWGEIGAPAAANALSSTG